MDNEIYCLPQYGVIRVPIVDKPPVDNRKVPSYRERRIALMKQRYPEIYYGTTDTLEIIYKDFQEEAIKQLTLPSLVFDRIMGRQRSREDLKAAHIRRIKRKLAGRLLGKLIGYNVWWAQLHRPKSDSECITCHEVWPCITFKEGIAVEYPSLLGYYSIIDGGGLG